MNRLIDIDMCNLELRVSSSDKHHPSLEEQKFYLLKKRLNPAWRPRCLDCGTTHPMIRCQNSYHCSACKTERTHSMILICKHYVRGSKL